MHICHNVGVVGLKLRVARSPKGYVQHRAVFRDVDRLSIEHGVTNFRDLHGAREFDK